MESRTVENRKIKFVKLSKESILPTKATEGSAGMDLYACIKEEIVINPGDLVKIPCGISVEVPEGYGAFIFARSGLGIKHGIGLSNGVGVVDSDYRGEVCVGLCNIGNEQYTIKNKDRIAQMVLLKTENFVPFEVDKLSETARGEGGFGSTGK